MRAPAYAKFNAKLKLARKGKVKPPVKHKKKKLKKVLPVEDRAWVRGESTDSGSTSPATKPVTVPVKEGSIKAKLDWLKAMESETKKIKAAATFSGGSKTFK